MELLTEDFLLKMRRFLDFEWVWYCGSTLAVSLANPTSSALCQCDPLGDKNGAFRDWNK